MILTLRKVNFALMDWRTNHAGLARLSQTEICPLGASSFAYPTTPWLPVCHLAFQPTYLLNFAKTHLPSFDPIRDPHRNKQRKSAQPGFSSAIPHWKSHPQWLLPHASSRGSLCSVSRGQVKDVPMQLKNIELFALSGRQKSPNGVGAFKPYLRGEVPRTVW